MAQKGMVAFFDILGYQDIIDNNLIEDVAKIILDILLKLPLETRDSMIDMIKGVAESNARVMELLDSIRYRVISDSILLVCEIPEDKRSLEKFYWSIFLLYVLFLLQKSFKSGLPLRGAIDYGEFFIDSNCFAGKPIINCYRLSNRMEFSGCVLTSDCGKILRACLDSTGNEDIKVIVDRYVLSYLVPLKDEEVRLWTVVWTIGGGVIGDVRQYITKGFQAHNKDVHRNVYPKIENTEIMVRCFMERHKNIE